MKKSTKLCIILVSVCLALALLAGALLVSPKWTADDPVDTADTTDTTIAAHTTADETIELPTPELITADLSTLVGNLEGRGSYYTFLNVFCDPGDTVTLTSDNDCLAVLDVPFSTAMSVDSASADSALGLLHIIHRPEQPAFYSTPNGLVEYGYFEKTVTFDPRTSCVYMKLRTNEDAEQEEATITFTVRNPEGQITGAGCVVVVKRYLLSVEERKTRPPVLDTTLFRSAVPCSVRFVNPEALTEERLAEIMAEFASAAEAAKAALDFTPDTLEERHKVAKAKIVSMVIAEDGNITGSEDGTSNEWNDYCIFGVTTHVPRGSHFPTHSADERNFLIFEDGTWVEFLAERNRACILSFCHADPNCPNSAEHGVHHPFDWGGCHLVTTDGRIYELVPDDWGNGIRGTTKLIYDPNA